MTRPASIVLLGLALLVGCDGSELRPLQPDSGAPLDADLSALSCATDEGVAARVFEAHCADSGCHDGDRPRAGLDLVSPGLASRLRGVNSVHDDCANRPIVAPGDARGSFMLDKVLGLEGTCGDPMPLEGELPLEARRCLVEWIDALPR